MFNYSQAALLALLVTPCQHLAAGAIHLTDVRLEVLNSRQFRLTLTAGAEGVRIGSFGMRTAEKSTAPLPGFDNRNGYLYFVPGDKGDRGGHMLIDNGPHDADPTPGRFGFVVSTAGWPDGRYTFLAYADNRPAKGRYVADRTMVQVAIANGRIDPGQTVALGTLHTRITSWSVAPRELDPGEEFVVQTTAESNDPAGVDVFLMSPYTVLPDETPPGFTYNPKTKHFYRRQRASDGAFHIDTVGWRPGVYHLTIQAQGKSFGQQVATYRDFAVCVRSVKNPFDIAIEADVFVAPGTHFGTFCRLRDGRIIAHNRVSEDGGRSWKPFGKTLGNACQLSNGTVLGIGFRTKPAPGKSGCYTTELYRSTDGLKTVERLTAMLFAPRATKGIGHAPAPGPLFWGGMVEMPDSRLLATLYGWFKGDESPVPGQRGSYRYRTFLAESRDNGRTWNVVTTIAYDPNLGTEGYCEPVMKRLRNGDLLCLLRTGGDNRPYWQDNPLCQTRSTDGGKTWARPHRIGVDGVDPDLCIMTDGTLACSYGRPGADLMLSPDNGHTWTGHRCIHPERYSGYTAVCEVEPGVLLYGYGAMGYLDETTGKRSNQLRVARVRVRRK